MALLKKLRYDLTACQGKLSEVIRMVGELPIETGATIVRCPHCGPGLEIKGALTLAEHLFNQHDGPVPAHYAAIEARALEPETFDDDEPSVST